MTARQRKQLSAADEKLVTDVAELLATPEPEPLIQITEPGLYDLHDEDYHGQRHSLSSTGVRQLLPPSCPAKFRWAQDNPQHKEPWDLGHAAHRLILGIGTTIDVIDADSWRTNKAKAERAASYAAGRVPLLPDGWDTAVAMAESIEAHGLAAGMLRGVNERAMFARDEHTGVLLRSKPDAINDDGDIVDLKSTTDTNLDALQKTIARWGYHTQGATYLEVAAALDIIDPATAGFVLVFVEKTAPYLVRVVECDDESLARGRAHLRRALETYRDCTESGLWPGWDARIETLGLPAWADRDDDSEEEW